MKGPTSPFEIPLIVDLISQDLSKKDIANCILVNSDFHAQFKRHHWHEVKISADKQRYRNKGFSPDYRKAILENGHLIRKLSIRGEIFRDVPNSSHPLHSVRFLESSRVFTIDSSTLWESIASLPRLEGLTIQNQCSGETDALWEACSRLKKLCLVNLRFKGIPAFATTGTSLELTFHLLQDLTLSNCGFDIAVQVLLITECQGLERLEWRIDQYLIGDAAQSTAFVQDFTKNLESEKWPNINWGLTRALSNRALGELDVPTTQFGELAFDALKHHFSTLRVLNIRNCPNLISANVLETLASCPHFQSLMVGRIYAQYLDPNQEWPYRGTFQYLSIEFELRQEPNPDESSSTVTAGKAKELSKTVFSCLSQLRELKHLNIGYRKSDKNPRQTYTRASIASEIRLCKGLGELAGLRKLGQFSVDVLTSSLGSKEIDWMLEN